MAIECKHGHLARSCYRCDDEREIARLRSQVSTLRGALAPVVTNRSYDPKILDPRESYLFGTTSPNGAISIVMNIEDLRHARRALEETK